MAETVINLQVNSMQVMANIVAGIASGTPNFDPKKVPDVMQRIHDKIVQLDKVRIDYPNGMPAELLEAAGLVAEAEANSLKGSTVIDDSELWPGVPEEKRQHFLFLARRYHLGRDKDNYPIPHAPDGQIGTHDGVYDPFVGEKMQMLKSRIRKSYQLDRDDLITMFRLPSDFSITAPAYSERKRAQANEFGLGGEGQAERSAEIQRERDEAALRERRAKATEKKRAQRAKAKAAQKPAAAKAKPAAPAMSQAPEDVERRAKAAQKKREQRARQRQREIEAAKPVAKVGKPARAPGRAAPARRARVAEHA